MPDGPRVLLVTVGRRADPRVEAWMAEYRRRLPTRWQWDWVRIPEASGGALPAEQVMAREGRQVLDQVAGRLVIALAVQGQQDDSDRWAARFGDFLEQGRPLALVVGGAYGLSEEVLERADHLWSLSSLTFPHQLVPLLIVEQLYRAHTILTHHPYHKS